MSKKRLIASLVIALAAVAVTGWWAARTFWLTDSLGASQNSVMFSYGSALARGGEGSEAFMMYLVEANGQSGHSGVRALDRADYKGPVPVTMPSPPYTPQAKKDKVQGAVIAAVDVDANGTVAGVKITTLSLSRNLTDGLDQSVIDTVHKWKFIPAMRKNKPVPATVRVQVNFRLS